jgi:hypothetical protein
VVADRLRRQAELRRDGAVVLALRDPVEDLALARRQLRERQAGRLGRAEVPDHAGGHAGADDHLPGHHRPQRGEDVVLLGALQQVAAGAGAHRREHRLVVLEHREDEDGDAGQQRRQPPGGLDAVHRGHLHVHHDDVRPGELGLAQRLRAGRGLGDHLDAVERRQQRGHAAPDDRVVVGDEHTDRGYLGGHVTDDGLRGPHPDRERPLRHPGRFPGGRGPGRMCRVPAGTQARCRRRTRRLRTEESP